jgi:crotonobetainyl-CoA:carnitine CoA-transferase CaiB-like acyl-CoA transferase
MIFMAVLSERQWAGLCKALGVDHMARDERYAGNDRRLANVAEVRRALEAETMARTCDELCVLLEANGVPYAPVRKPSELFTDPQMNVAGRMLPIEFKAGEAPTNMPALPIMIEGETLKLRRQPPGPGEHTAEILKGLGYSDDRIATLLQGRVVSSG